ncbi:MAG: SAM-dependent methyltransferase [Bacteroidetes bacterium]|nr:SAM-dependent methyltransferase [Bacteroidota bacterium]
MSAKGILYLFPVTLGDNMPEDVLPEKNIKLIQTLSHFICENAREARAFLKRCGYPDISKAQLSELNKHADLKSITSFLDPVMQGHDMGLMSDAGCPGIADPGADIMKLAHQKGIRVVPLVGPSSIVLSIMASGFNGQNFAFNGYLPIDKNEKLKRLRDLERLATDYRQAQYFIETPYRNSQLFEDLLKTLRPATQLLVATHLTLPDERIIVKSVAEWKKSALPDFQKKPTVFGIQ